MVLPPGPSGSFDGTSVKDPSVVRFEGKWHVFYTARGEGEYTTGYVAAETWEGLADAPRHYLPAIRGAGVYGCAPQVFFFRPHGLWYLVFQTDDDLYQSAYSTTRNLHDPLSWSQARPLLSKDEPSKWIDFWTICDGETAYLFYTREHSEVMVRTTPQASFPGDWGPASMVLAGVYEAVHVYKAVGRDEFHLFYEMNGGDRLFGLATAPSPAGPWRKVTERYAAREMLVGQSWTEMVSHGELLRSGFDERLEYDPGMPQWLFQGVRGEAYEGPYSEIRWNLGLMGR